MESNTISMPRIGDKVKVIVPPPKTTADYEARLADDTLEKIDWYLAKKTL